MWWLQHPKQSNVDNLNKERHEASRHFRKKRKGTGTRTNVVKDKKGDLVTHSHSIMAMHRNHFSQLQYMWLMISGRMKYRQQSH